MRRDLATSYQQFVVDFRPTTGYMDPALLIIHCSGRAPFVGFALKMLIFYQ